MCIARRLLIVLRWKVGRGLGRIWMEIVSGHRTKAKRWLLLLLWFLRVRRDISIRLIRNIWILREIRS